MNNKAQTALRIELELLNRAELYSCPFCVGTRLFGPWGGSRGRLCSESPLQGLTYSGTKRALSLPPVPTATESPDPTGSVVVFSDDWSELRRSPPPHLRRPLQRPTLRLLVVERSLHAQGFSLRKSPNASPTRACPPVRRGTRAPCVQY